MVRFKSRYLLASVSWSTRFPPDVSNKNATSLHRVDSGELLRSLKSVILEQMGDFGFAQLIPSLQVKLWNNDTGTLIVRVAMEYCRMLWSCLTFVSFLNKIPVCVRVVHVAATMRSCQLASLRICRRELSSLTSATASQCVRKVHLAPPSKKM